MIWICMLLNGPWLTPDTACCCRKAVSVVRQQMAWGRADTGLAHVLLLPCLGRKHFHTWHTWWQEYGSSGLGCSHKGSKSMAHKSPKLCCVTRENKPKLSTRVFVHPHQFYQCMCTALQNCYLCCFVLPGTKGKVFTVAQICSFY